MLASAWDTQANPDEALAAAEEALARIKTGSYNTDPVTMWDATMAAVQEIDDIVKRIRLSGTMIGLPQFDEEIGGFFRGELVILGARPGQGKTSLALQMATHCAARGRRVYFATLEMGATELALKQLATESGVSSQRIRAGKIDEHDRAQLSEASQRVAVKNLVLHDWPEIRPFDIQRAARRFDAEIVFVDYLQIVSPPDAKKKRYEQVGDISRQLKTIARQMDVPVVACAQIGRQAEQRAETRPKLSDLRESGNIENDCDMALLLWRPENGIKGKKGTPHEGQEWDADLEVAKNRKGVRKRFRLVWHGDETRFSCFGCFTPQEPGGTDWDADNSLDHLGGFQ
jgi:replicative DNA helicase